MPGLTEQIPLLVGVIRRLCKDGGDEMGTAIFTWNP